jgi:hypothetical protein
MKTKTAVITAVIIAAATAVLVIAPLGAPVMALRNGGSTQTTTCVHNGNGAPGGSPPCGPGESAQPVTTTTYKCHGKFQATPCT